MATQMNPNIKKALHRSASLPSGHIGCHLPMHFAPRVISSLCSWELVHRWPRPSQGRQQLRELSANPSFLFWQEWEAINSPSPKASHKYSHFLREVTYSWALTNLSLWAEHSQRETRISGFVTLPCQLCFLLALNTEVLIQVLTPCHLMGWTFLKADLHFGWWRSHMYVSLKS